MEKRGREFRGRGGGGVERVQPRNRATKNQGAGASEGRDAKREAKAKKREAAQKREKKSREVGETGARRGWRGGDLKNTGRSLRCA